MVIADHDVLPYIGYTNMVKKAPPIESIRAKLDIINGYSTMYNKGGNSGIIRGAGNQRSSLEPAN